ncbi:MAG TPA: YkvA family protein [Candidatus Kapabacteria bacterium]|jgi:uncharacterized membrane protein YkvA (DUF1232 family)|nr:DUF1232 domain-containing protein [Ignavibacteria bacterium]HRK58889.1 YkvA family protein [Candidatus Kapabacteria bacterium]
MVVSQHNSEKILDNAAESYSPDKEKEVVRRLPSKLQSVRKAAQNSGLLTNLFRNITTLYAMLTEKDYALSLKSKAMIVAALAYFILPTDLTPDFIPFVGYIDDGIVITALMKRVKSEIDRFLQWKADI